MSISLIVSIISTISFRMDQIHHHLDSILFHSINVSFTVNLETDIDKLEYRQKKHTHFEKNM